MIQAILISFNLQQVFSKAFKKYENFLLNLIWKNESILECTFKKLVSYLLLNYCFIWFFYFIKHSWAIFLQIDILDCRNIGTDAVLKCWKHWKDCELEQYELHSLYLYKCSNAWGFNLPWIKKN